MATIPTLTPVAVLAAHVESCDVGERFCADCRAARDSGVINAINVAHRESRRIGDFIQRHAWLCVYCAGFAEHKDHLVPEPWTGATARRFVPVVPACADCNYTISDATRFTIPERAAIVAERIRHKHRKQLAIPDRDDEWFDDLGDRMRSNLRARQAFRQELRRRLQVLEAGGADCVVDNLWIST